MSKMLSKMNLISVVQQLPSEDIELVQNYVEMIENENEELKKHLNELQKPQIFIDTQDIEERYGEELYQDYLKEKVEELKKQLEDMTDCRDIASGHRKEVQDRETILLNQQQEFIKYLEDEINKTDYEINILGNYPYLAWSNACKKNLQKYKEIIGNDINVGSKGEDKDE